MKKLLLFLSLAIFATATEAQTTISGSFDYDGVTRTYKLYVPEIYNTAGVSVPLVFNLHGLGSNNDQQNFYGDLKPFADADNFIICLPNGTFNSSGQRFWNAGFGMGVDDIGFINALIDTIMSSYNIDTAKVYSTGMSNGGFMSITLACELSHRVSKVASVTGTMVAGQAMSCNPDSGIPVMLIHGTNDPTVPYNGGGTVIPAMLGVDSVIRFWVNLNECQTTPIFTPVPNNDPNDGSTAERYDYIQGKDNSSVVLYKIIGGGHTWPGSTIQLAGTNMDFSASEEIWNFFKAEEYTSIKNQKEAHNFNIYPNPSKGMVVLETKDVSKIELISILGKKMMETTVANSETTLDISFLPSGVYWVNFHTKNGVSSKKLIKN
jgi:polyhydroxybutyrate depolymerase